QYIVRAVVSNGGVPLATGLAASVDVQIAEDKARDRAIALLGLQIEDVQIEGIQANATPANATPANVIQIESAQTKNQPKATSTDVFESNGVQTNGYQKIESESTLSIEEPLPLLTLEPVGSDEPEEDAVSLEPPDAELDPSDDSGPPLEAMAEPSQPSAATIALENFSTSPNPVDLSDVIAQTDVELTRLGWSNAQGREYLEKTYSKRSRQQLTDEELLGFLLYLEDQ
ncbi:MAG: hypothetical protein WA947_09635, partial [Phormidesmis sp.]